MLPGRNLEAIGAVGVNQSSRFVGMPNLSKPFYREKTVYIKTHKTVINRPVDQERRNTHFKEGKLFFIEILSFS